MIIYFVYLIAYNLICVSMKSIKILLVDDNAIIRKSLLLLLSKIPHVNVVGECVDGVEVIPFIKHHQVDVIFMDISMKFMDGYEATERVKQYYPGVKVIGFSSQDCIATIDKMIASGADGFISKYNAEKPLIIAELDRVMNL